MVVSEDRCWELKWTTIKMILIWSFGMGSQELPVLSWPSSASPSGAPEGASHLGTGEGALAGACAPTAPSGGAEAKRQVQ